MANLKDREKQREKQKDEIKTTTKSAVSGIMNAQVFQRSYDVKPKETPERKSANINFKAYPSLMKQVKIKCKKYNISISECIGQLLKGWVAEE